jgi:hypothetical protein
MSDYTPKKQRVGPVRIIYLTMMWSKALVPVIAFFAAVGSAVRTFQTTAEIYTAGGTSFWAAVGVSLVITIAVEGAIFGLAMARQWQEIKWRQARKKRHVMSLRSVWRSVQVRIGIQEPLSYDQLPESNGVVTLVMFIAFSYALISNFNMGVRPLIDKIGGSSSLQAFMSSLLTAPATIQISFIVDSASILFPPFMALAAGHLTARWSAEIVTSMNRTGDKPERKRTTQAEARVEQSSKGARERVVDHLLEHPEDAGLSQQKLAKKLKVSAGTVNAVYKERRSTEYSIEHSSNGHSHE